MTADGTVGRELTEQYPQVISRDAIGGTIQGKPSSTEHAVNGDVASGFKWSDPIRFIALNGGHLDFARGSIGQLSQSNGDIAVIRKLGSDAKQQGVCVLTQYTSERILVERRRCVDVRLKAILTHDTGERVRWIDHGDEQLVSGHPGDTIHSHLLELDTVALNHWSVEAAAVVTRAIFEVGHFEVVTR